VVRGSLPASDVEALVAGRHPDPFAVLGPHVCREGGATAVAIRAFLPGAVAAEVRPGEPGLLTREMERLHPDGVFEATFPGRAAPFRYRLFVTDSPGSTREIEDPYRFPSTLSDFDRLLLGEGTHYKAYEKLGAHATVLEGVAGVVFAVWAPNARRVSVVGDFNGWDGRRHPMRLHPGAGLWELFVPGLGEGARYKFEILGQAGGLLALKADPFAFEFEVEEPRTASVVASLDGHSWNDGTWMAERGRRSALDRRGGDHDRPARHRRHTGHVGRRCGHRDRRRYGQPGHDRAQQRAFLRRFEAISPSGLAPQEALSRTLMIGRLRDQLAEGQLKNWEMPLDQMNGLHLFYAELPGMLTFKTARDYEDYLARLHAIPRVLNQLETDMRLGIEDRLMQPRYLLEKVAVQVRQIAGETGSKSPFAVPVAKFPAAIAEADQSRLRSEVLHAIDTEVNPAYARLADFVTKDYAPRGRTEPGVWSLPDGNARYRQAIRHMTTTNLSPGETPPDPERRPNDPA